MGSSHAETWRRVRHAAVCGLLPLAFGIGLMADAFHRKPAPVITAQEPGKLRGIPWDQQLYWMEVGLGFILILGGGLAANAILSSRR